MSVQWEEEVFDRVLHGIECANLSLNSNFFTLSHTHTPIGFVTISKGKRKNKKLR